MPESPQTLNRKNSSTSAQHFSLPRQTSGIYKDRANFLPVFKGSSNKAKMRQGKESNQKTRQSGGIGLSVVRATKDSPRPIISPDDFIDAGLTRGDFFESLAQQFDSEPHSQDMRIQLLSARDDNDEALIDSLVKHNIRSPVEILGKLMGKFDYTPEQLDCIFDNANFPSFKDSTLILPSGDVAAAVIDAVERRLNLKNALKEMRKAFSTNVAGGATRALVELSEKWEAENISQQARVALLSARDEDDRAAIDLLVEQEIESPGEVLEKMMGSFVYDESQLKKIFQFDRFATFLRNHTPNTEKNSKAKPALGWSFSLPTLSIEEQKTETGKVEEAMRRLISLTDAASKVLPTWGEAMSNAIAHSHPMLFAKVTMPLNGFTVRNSLNTLRKRVRNPNLIAGIWLATASGQDRSGSSPVLNAFSDGNPTPIQLVDTLMDFTRLYPVTAQGLCLRPDTLETALTGPTVNVKKVAYVLRSYLTFLIQSAPYMRSEVNAVLRTGLLAATQDSYFLGMFSSYKSVFKTILNSDPTLAGQYEQALHKLAARSRHVAR